MEYELQLLLFFMAIGIIFSVPFLRSFFKILILLTWGLFLPIGAAFVIIGIRIPSGDYLSAIITIIVVGAIQIPWFLIGWPEIKNTFKNGEWGFK